ncbi:hypothetical protein B0G57_101266 [Trinickia symbiotica]|nr:hypothetical protein B0G57_101266 [Trinickia symbiotica]
MIDLSTAQTWQEQNTEVGGSSFVPLYLLTALAGFRAKARTAGAGTLNTPSDRYGAALSATDFSILQQAVAQLPWSHIVTSAPDPGCYGHCG